MSKPWILVSPASKGIGHALTRHLLRNTTLPILATSRSDPSTVKSSLLDDLPSHEERLTVLQLDVTSESTIKQASQVASEMFPTSSHHLHLAFALPGILHPEKSPAQIEYDTALETLKVNTLGPMMLMKYFFDFLPKKKTSISHPEPSRGEDSVQVRIPPRAVWTTLAARVGSTSDNNLGGWYSYRASKSGVISLSKTFDLYLRQSRSKEMAMSVAYHPGTVKTGLSKEFWGNVKEEKLFSPEYAADKLLEVVNSRGVDDRGKCWDWKGEEIPS